MLVTGRSGERKRRAAPTVSLALSILSLSILVGLSSSPARAQATADDWLGADKALHFGASTALAGAGYGVTAVFTDTLSLRLSIGAGVALAAGAAKELLDLAGLGTPSWRDFTWDVIGTATGLLVSVLVDLVVRALTAEAPSAGRPAEAAPGDEAQTHARRWSRGLGCSERCAPRENGGEWDCVWGGAWSWFAVHGL